MMDYYNGENDPGNKYAAIMLLGDRSYLLHFSFFIV